ncbi:MAG: EF-hand domain-containing protein [Pirellula sp.]
MSNESANVAPKKRPALSPWFLLVSIGIAAVLVFTVPWVMTQIMYLQEQDWSKKRAFIYEGQPPAAAEPASEGGGGGGRGSGGGGGGGRDPDAIFARMDADSNGKVEGEEISDRLKGRMDQIDTDKDGALSKEEFIAGMQSRSRDGGSAGGSVVPKRNPNAPQPTPESTTGAVEEEAKPTTPSEPTAPAKASDQ